MLVEAMGLFDKLKHAVNSKKGQPTSAPDPIGGAEFNTSPELMCGIRPGMSRDEIKERLALLFRRHNRMASSLDEERRKEAETMLDAIVVCRQKYVDLD